MRSKAKRTAAGAACALLVSLAVTASPAGAGEIYLGPSAYYATPDSSLHAKSDFGGGVNVGFRFTPHWGAELLSESSRFEFNDGSGALNELGASLQGMFRYKLPDSQFSPFAVLGAGWLHSKYDNLSNNAPLVRGGGGLIWDLPQQPWSFRADADLRHVIGNSAIPFYAKRDQNDEIYSLSVQYSFGGDHQQTAELQTPTPADAFDKFPLTTQSAAPAESRAKPSNCTVDSKTVTCSGLPDQDGDGVPDAQDKCPDTPPNAVVDADGCLLYLRK